MESDGAYAHGRALFATHCAQCHGVDGRGAYAGETVSGPAIAGTDEAKVIRQMRTGSRRMPALPAVSIPDAAARDVAGYVHQALAHPAEAPGHLGPRALDPFVLGVFVWGAFGVLACVLALLFAEGRN